MNKYKIAEQARKILYPSGTNDAAFSMQEALLAVGQARDRLIQEDYYQKLNSEERYIAFNYVAVYDNNGQGYSVQMDAVKNRAYLDLPCRIIDLPKQRGLVQVTTIGFEEDAYVPIEQTALAMYKGLEDMDGEKFYYPQGQRLYFSKNVGEDTKISILAIPSGESLDPFEDFAFPSNLEQELVNRTIQLYSAQKGIPQDKINDNASQ